ncbi:uncharacterized protein [Parasteatoda tepidariorum]|uniref:uncharacterized protein n=1 Tax=Parasteatoda tepidariorum TaxID=114398 RepID=UPI00077FC9CE|nr:uncharacterized protein LOC107450250 [Parasteatoda tepidariorum]
MGLQRIYSILFIFLIPAFFHECECKHLGTLSQTGTKIQEKEIECLKKNIDEYLNNVLKRARKELPDPMRLPPRSAIVDLKDGVMWGLSSLEKMGKAVVSCDGANVTIHVKLTVDELKGRYTWIKENRRKTREGYVTFICNDFAADVIIIIRKQNSEITHPHLERLEIKKFRDVKVEMTGLGLLSWALGEITTRLSGIFQRTIASAVQDPLIEAIQRQMREINITSELYNNC